jgi:hypothetical protein
LEEREKEFKSVKEIFGFPDKMENGKVLSEFAFWIKNTHKKKPNNEGIGAIIRISK